MTAGKPAVAKAPVSDPAATEARPAATDGKGRFTLQLSAFQVKAEAEAFAAEVGAAGYKAYLTEAVVDGKGTFFRVRLGRYGSYDEAVAAKGEFEQRLKKIAYVTRL